jgi:hypothetical protein
MTTSKAAGWGDVLEPAYVAKARIEIPMRNVMRSMRMGALKTVR